MNQKGLNLNTITLNCDELYHMKTKYGADIICQIVHYDEDGIIISDAIQVHMSPSVGVFSTKWTHFSANDVANIKREDILFMSLASDYALELYSEVFHKDSEYNEILEESLHSTKH